MSGSILFKKAIIDDENYKDDESMINGKTEMYHFCYWVNNKISDSRHYINENDNFIIEEATYETIHDFC